MTWDQSAGVLDAQVAPQGRDCYVTDKARNGVFSRVFLEKFKPGAYLEDVINDVQQAVHDLAQTAKPRAFTQIPYYSDGVLGRACIDERCGAGAVGVVADTARRKKEPPQTAQPTGGAKADLATPFELPPPPPRTAQ